MNLTIEAVCTALDNISDSILGASSESRNMMTMYGWNNAPLNPQDLANITTNLSNQLRGANIEKLEASLEAELSNVPAKLEQLHTSSLILYMFNGNGATAIPTFMATINWLQILVSPLTGWQNITDPKTMPAHLARRVRSIDAELTGLVPNKEALQDQIKLIQDATSAAENLPTDLQGLREARKEVIQLTEDSSEKNTLINGYLESAKKAANAASDLEVEIDKIVNKSNQALRGATSVGLAASFDERAKSLNSSIYYWVAGLSFALIVSIVIGTLRYETLASKLNDTNPNWGIIAIHITLSVLSLAAPVWFAWLSTKQISQRFKLAEDYAFKASVAKAYEGYRTEAVSINEEFVARLFGSALTRLEEAPLRLVGEQEHSSPLQEILASKGFQKAMEAAPGLGDTLIKAIKDSLEVATGKLNKKTSNSNVEEPI